MVWWLKQGGNKVCQLYRFKHWQVLNWSELAPLCLVAAMHSENRIGKLQERFWHHDFHFHWNHVPGVWPKRWYSDTICHAKIRGAAHCTLVKHSCLLRLISKAYHSIKIRKLSQMFLFVTFWKGQQHLYQMKSQNTSCLPASYTPNQLKRQGQFPEVLLLLFKPPEMANLCPKLEIFPKCKSCQCWEI